MVRRLILFALLFHAELASASEARLEQLPKEILTAEREAEAAVMPSIQEEAELKRLAKRWRESGSERDRKAWETLNNTRPAARELKERRARVASLRAEYERLLEAEPPVSPALEALDGFQRARWGMSEPEVRAAFKGARDIDGALTWRGKVADQRAAVVFTFVQRKLTVAHVRFDREPKGGRGEVYRYESLLDALVKRYGPPSDWEVNELSGARSATWRGPKTEVVLEFQPFSIVSPVTLTYRSRELAHLVEEIDEKAAEEL